MSYIVDELYAMSRYEHDDMSLCEDAADEILSLRTRLEAAEKDAARLNLELQKRDKCSYMGPMRDCPTHGESAELKAMREAMTKEPT